LEPAGTVHIERLNGTLRDRLGALTRKTHAFAKRDATWDALVGEAALRSQLSSSPSGFAVACCRLWRASVSPPLSRYGSGADQSSLVVPRIVNHPRSCHPLMGSLPTIQSAGNCCKAFAALRSPSVANGPALTNSAIQFLLRGQRQTRIITY